MPTAGGVNSKARSVETAYSIVVCIAICYINGVLTSWNNTSAVFIDKLEIEFKHVQFVEAEASLITTLCSCILNVSLAMFMILARTFGLRLLATISVLVAAAALSASTLNNNLAMWVLSYSIPVGLGFSCAYGCYTVAMPMYFDRHIGRVNGAMSFASSLLSIFVPLFWDALAPLGFQNTIFVFSGILVSTIIPFALIIPRSVTQEPEDGNNTEHSNSRSESDTDSASPNDENAAINEDETNTLFENAPVDVECEQSLLSDTVETNGKCPTIKDFFKKLARVLHLNVFTNRFYLVMSIGMTVSYIGIYAPIYHVPAFAQLYFPNEDPNLLISAMALGQALSKLSSSSLTDFVPLKVSYYILQVAFVGCGLTAIAIPFAITYANNFNVVMGTMVVYGLFEGPIFGVNLPILCRVLDAKSNVIALAYQYGLLSLSGLIGPPCAGLIYGFTQSYSLCYYAASIFLILGAMLMFDTKCLTCKR